MLFLKIKAKDAQHQAKQSSIKIKMNPASNCEYVASTTHITVCYTAAKWTTLKGRI